MSKKIALVTGGIGGIGSEIVKALANQGHKVIAGHLAFEQEKAEEWLSNATAEGLDVGIAAGDVSDFDDTKAMIEKITAEHGTIQILVNCAGITRDSSLKKMDPDNWYAVINTNLNSVFNVTKSVFDGMLDAGWGRIVNISSVNGQKGQFGQTNYSAAKAGVHGFTMALAQEGARKGVTANTVSPGYIATAMTEKIAPEIRESIVAQVPMGRMGTPTEIGNAVAFFTKEESGYVTGANLPVNGALFTSF